MEPRNETVTKESWHKAISEFEALKEKYLKGPYTHGEATDNLEKAPVTSFSNLGFVSAALCLLSVLLPSPFSSPSPHDLHAQRWLLEAQASFSFLKRQNKGRTGFCLPVKTFLNEFLREKYNTDSRLGVQKRRSLFYTQVDLPKCY